MEANCKEPLINHMNTFRVTVPLILFYGRLQGVPVLVVLQRDVCALVQQQLQGVGEPLLGCQVQRRRLVVVRRVHVGAIVCISGWASSAPKVKLSTVTPRSKY
jgi:hypothetical protein